jgi:hypothetical protein
MAFLQKSNVFHDLALFQPKTPIFWQFFWRKYFKNHNTGPWIWPNRSCHSRRYFTSTRLGIGKVFN